MNTQTDAWVSCMSCTASSLPHCSAVAGRGWRSRF